VSVVESGTAVAFTASFSRSIVAGASGSVDLVITPTSDFNGAVDNVTLKLITPGSVTPAIVILDSAALASVEIRGTGNAAQNLGIGQGVHRSLTSGAANFGAGFQAQYELTTGTSNTGAGYGAQYSLVGGASNTAGGRNAQRSLTFGSFNCGFGRDTQYSLTTGSSNTGGGTSAQRELIAGSNNTAYGNAAQRYLANGSSSATAAENCVYIGASTKQSADSVTNENVFGYNATGIGSNSCVIGSSAVTKCQLYGDIILDKTVTASGTTGAQTINKTVGSVNFAAAASSLVVTNSRVTTASVIIATVATNDTTLKSVVAVAGSGSVTLTANAAATAETRVNFIVIN
jgi:hypothetical protein